MRVIWITTLSHETTQVKKISHSETLALLDPTRNALSEDAPAVDRKVRPVPSNNARNKILHFEMHNKRDRRSRIQISEQYIKYVKFVAM